jgi:hypothetical protein
VKAIEEAGYDVEQAIVGEVGNASALPELLSHFGSAVTRKFMA